jgi:Ca2+-dependent lipid-binding protein
VGSGSRPGFSFGANLAGISELQAQLNLDDVRITETHRLLVEVREAKGLRPSDLSGLADPFAQMSLKVADRSLKSGELAKFRQLFHTYVIEKTLDPKWQSQVGEERKEGGGVSCVVQFP